MSKYNLDLDYATPLIDISREELNEIISEADAIISENKRGDEELAEAYLKKAQCLQKLEEYTQFENIESINNCQNINIRKQKKIKTLIEKALILYTNIPEAINQLGKYYYKMSISGNNNFDKAIDMYTIAIELKPGYAAAYNNRSVLYASKVYSEVNISPQENLYKAINDFTEAIKIRPFYAMYYYNRGRNYSKLQDHKKAIDDLSGAIQHGSVEFKKKIPLYYLRGDEYMWLRNYDKSIDDFSQQILLRPDLIRSFLMRGNAYLGIGEREKAKADMDEYLRRKKSRIIMA